MPEVGQSRASGSTDPPWYRRVLAADETAKDRTEEIELHAADAEISDSGGLDRPQLLARKLSQYVVSGSIPLEGGDGKKGERRMRMSLKIMYKVVSLFFFKAGSDVAFIAWSIACLALVAIFCWLSYDLVLLTGEFSTVMCARRLLPDPTCRGTPSYVSGMQGTTSRMSRSIRRTKTELRCRTPTRSPRP